jgi:site-specific recombinase XerD
MFVSKSQDQGTIVLSQQDYLLILVESFLIDRRSQGLSGETIHFYRKKIEYFLRYCEAQAVTQVSEITPDLIRRYMLQLAATHNEGGTHACFRPLRTFLYWVEAEEIMEAGWKNPMRRVKAPRLSVQPLDPISMEDVHALVAACSSGFSGARNTAIILSLLDTGARASEFLALNLEDLDLAAGSALIRKGKGRRPRMVFLGRKSRRAIRAYLRGRHDSNPALWLTDDGDRMTYAALRGVVRRRAQSAGLKHEPSLHDFRRAFAINMLRGGADVFSLQRLMGHADLQVLRRYLAQTDADIHGAHMRGSPVDNNL